MAERSSALYDYAVATHADADLDLLPGLLADLRKRFPKPPPSMEIHGKPSSGEVVVLFRFAFVHYSSALRQKMETEAGRLKGRLIEPELLAPEARERFYKAHLPGHPVRQDASGDPAAAVEAFRGQMGLSRAAPPFVLRFESADALAAAYARCVAEGSLFVPSQRSWPAGTPVGLLLQAPGEAALQASGCVLAEATEGLQRGFLALVSPGEDLLRFVARHADARRHGRRRMPEGGQRAHPRFDTCLEVSFDRADPKLREEWATNIGQGGLFVRTEAPPALRAKVLLRVRLGEEVAETGAEVVHVLGVEEARARRLRPGVGVAFDAADVGFRRRVEDFLARIPARKPRLLVADDDAFFRKLLRQALEEAGFEVTTAVDGEEALALLAGELFGLDAVILDLHMPGLNGLLVIDRIRRLGGEMDLKIVLITGTEDAELEAIRGPDGANEVLSKAVPFEELIAKITALLER